MEPQNETKNKTLHTLSEDMALALEKNEGGFIKGIIEEEERKEQEKKARLSYIRRNRVFVVLTILFLLLASGVVFFIIIKENPVSFFNKKRFNPIIFHEVTKLVDITLFNKDAIGQAINEVVINTEASVGEVLGLYLIEENKNIYFDNFLAKIESPFVPVLDSFEDNFLIGVIKNDNKNIINQNNDDLKNVNFNQNSKKVLDNFVIFSSKDFFKAGTTSFVDESAEQKMKELIGYFLDTLNADLSKIHVSGIFSSENQNKQSLVLAEDYKNFGIKILSEVAKDKYKEEEISKFTVESDTRAIGLNDLYTDNELSKIENKDKDFLIDLNNGIQFLATPKANIDLNEINDIETNPLPKIEVIKEVVSIYPSNINLFILLKTNPNSDLFSQMNAWENKMFSDLHDIFGIALSSDTAYLLTKNFENGIIQNKNARILKDNTGKIVLMYVYIDESHIVITNTESTTKEVIFRVNSSKVKK